MADEDQATRESQREAEALRAELDNLRISEKLSRDREEAATMEAERLKAGTRVCIDMRIAMHMDTCVNTYASIRNGRP